MIYIGRLNIPIKMAIKIIDSIPTRIGMSIANTVATLNGSYNVNKRNGIYTAESLATFFVDETQYGLNNRLESKLVQTVITVGDLSSNVMNLLYIQLKSQYTSTVDM
jgi:hypothetical protein